jgi:hypothetical protein
VGGIDGKCLVDVGAGELDVVGSDGEPCEGELHCLRCGRSERAGDLGLGRERELGQAEPSAAEVAFQFRVGGGGVFAERGLECGELVGSVQTCVEETVQGGITGGAVFEEELVYEQPRLGIEDPVAVVVRIEGAACGGEQELESRNPCISVQGGNVIVDGLAEQPVVFSRFERREYFGEAFVKPERQLGGGGGDEPVRRLVEHDMASRFVVEGIGQADHAPGVAGGEETGDIALLAVGGAQTVWGELSGVGE